MHELRSWSRQLVVLVLAAAAAAWQLSRTTTWLSAHEAAEAEQLSAALTLAATVPAVRSVFRGSPWRPPRPTKSSPNGVTAPSHSPADRADFALLIGTSPAADDVLQVLGELYVDPVQRSKWLQKRSAQAKRRSPKAKQTTESAPSRPDRADSQDSLLAFKVYDARLWPLAHDLERRGLVARVLYLGSSPPADTAKPERHRMHGHDAEWMPPTPTQEQHRAQAEALSQRRAPRLEKSESDSVAPKVASASGRVASRDENRDLDLGKIEL